MKKTILLTAMVAGLAAPGMAMDTNVLTTEEARVSYAIGLNLGQKLKQVEYQADTNAFVRGVQDGQSGAVALMTVPELTETMKNFNKNMQIKAQTLRAEQGMKSKLEGDAFLATNKNSPGVITLTNGLQYKVIKDGDGPIPKATDTVTVNYRGTLVNGTEFDSSATRGPFTTAVTRVIPGWTQALEMMKVGSKWQLYIPSELAYGPRGQGQLIPPNSVLIFDVELLDIAAPKPPMPPPAPSAPLTSDIIKVPSAEELKKGAKIEVIKPEDLQKAQAEGQTNMSPSSSPK